MKRACLALFATLSAASLTSCHVLSRKKLEPSTVAAGAGAASGVAPPVQGWALMYPELAKQNGSVGNPVGAAEGTPITAEGGMFDFSGVVQTGAGASSRLAWNQSATDAAKLARTTGKPMLTLFTHQRSQPAQSLEGTFLLTPEFRDLADKEFVLLRLDYSNEDTAGSDFYEAFKKRFKANGYPTLVVTTPDGSELMHESGYKPEWHARTLQSLKAAVIKAGKVKDERRKTMEKDGYRLWKDKVGTPVFAKLTALDANMGTFTGEWGESFKTFLSRLSEEDQAWIASRRKDV